MQELDGTVSAETGITISIIIPVYNVKEYLIQCLESILNQSYHKFEVILVDDGSTDGSNIICDEYVKKDKRISVIHNTNHGVSFSRNCGLDYAKGEVIAFVDADDYLHHDFLSVMMSELQVNEVDVVICNYTYVKGESVSHAFAYMKSTKLLRNEVCQGIFLGNSIGGFVWNKIFKRELLENIRFEESLQVCEDTYFVMNVLHKQPKLYYTSEALYNYRIREDSAINNVENLFDSKNRLKYGLAFEQIEEKGLLETEELPMLHAGLCMLATSTKCDYLIANGKDKAKLKDLNHRIWGNMRACLSMNALPIKKKAIVFANAIFNLRKLKK